MSSWKMFRIAIVAGSLAAPGAAFALGATSAQTHHCKMPDGTTDASKTHKACTAAKGTWAKDAPKDAAKDKTGATPAPTPPPVAAPPSPAK